MPESEIHMMSAIQNMEARPEDAAYGFRQQESEIKSRINTLFSHKEDGEGEDLLEGEDYETVNEGMTTDTTEAPQHAAKRGSLEESEGGVSSSSANKEEGEAIEEGILSSDEESAEKKSVKSTKVGDKPIASSSDSHDIRSFAEGGAASKLYDSDKAKEEIENKFNFGEQDVEYFGAKV